MSFTDIKTKSQGFTIVELLIVVVVIAILAAITIVSYTGITNRANAATAQESASNLQKKIETYAADGPTGTYPTILGTASNGLSVPGNSYTTPTMWSTGAGTAFNAPVTSSTPANTVQYYVCGRTNTAATAPTSIALMTAVTGAFVAYWNYTASPAAPAIVTSGAGTPTAAGFSGTLINNAATTTALGGTATVSGTSYTTACFPPAS